MALKSFSTKEQQDAAEQEMQKGLQDLFSGKVEEYDNGLICPADVMYYIEKIGGEDLSDSDTNGWDVDFWYNFRYEGKEYSIHGSAYYGGLKVYLKEE